MGCQLCAQRDKVIRYGGDRKGSVSVQGRGKKKEMRDDRMLDVRRRSFQQEEEDAVELYLEGLECICPTDPTGDNIMLFFVAGVSICAIAGGVFGTFVPKAVGLDAYEPMCTAAAATIFTVVFTSACDSYGLLEFEKEDIVAQKEHNGIVMKGVMTPDQFTAYQDDGQIVVEEWKSESADEVVFKVNEEAVVGAGTNLCRQTHMASGDFVPIDRTFKPENNGFRFELEEWDFQSDNNRLVPSPAGFFRVNSLKDTWDFTKNSKNPGLYFVSTTNKSIYVLYGRLQPKK